MTFISSHLQSQNSILSYHILKLNFLFQIVSMNSGEEITKTKVVSLNEINYIFRNFFGTNFIFFDIKLIIYKFWYTSVVHNSNKLMLVDHKYRSYIVSTANT